VPFGYHILWVILPIFWRKHTYEKLVTRNKTNFDLFWLKYKSLTDLEDLPEPVELAEKVIENVEAGLNGSLEVLAGPE